MMIYLVVSNIFYVHPYLGKIPILTNIFQMGWNHQPVFLWGMPLGREKRVPKQTFAFRFGSRGYSVLPQILNDKKEVILELRPGKWTAGTQQNHLIEKEHISFCKPHFLGSMFNLPRGVPNFRSWTHQGVFKDPPKVRFRSQAFQDPHWCLPGFMNGFGRPDVQRYSKGSYLKRVWYRKPLLVNGNAHHIVNVPKRWRLWFMALKFELIYIYIFPTGRRYIWERRARMRCRCIPRDHDMTPASFVFWFHRSVFRLFRLCEVHLWKRSRS